MSCKVVCVVRVVGEMSALSSSSSLDVVLLAELPGRLRSWREARGMSQRAVAEGSGLSLSTVSEMERASGPSMTVGTLQKWAKAVGVDASVLLRPTSAPAEPKAKSGGQGGAV